MDNQQQPDLLSGRTLFRSGLALVILAVTFLFRYSIEQGWIGPLARVGLAAGLGAIMIGLGVTLTKRPLYGNLLQGGGAAVLYLAAFAAHRQYQLIDNTEALIQLAAVATLTLALALRARSEALAGIALAGAASAPLVIGGRFELPGGDALYLTMVGIAAAYLLIRLHWLFAYLTATATISYAVATDVISDLLSSGGFRSAAPSDIDVIAAVTLAWTLLVAVPLYLAYVGDEDRRISVSLPSLTTTFGTPLAYAALFGAFHDDLSRLDWAFVAMAGSAIHIGAGIGLRRTGNRAVSRTQAIPAIIMGLLAMVNGLSGDWLLVGFAAVSAGLVIAGLRSDNRMMADIGITGFGMTMIASVITVAIVAGNSRTVTEVIPVGLVLALIGLTGLTIRLETEDDDPISTSLLGVWYVGSIMWMLFEFPRLGDSGLAIVTAGWAVLGLLAIAVGKALSNRPVLGLGFTTVGLALAKLFLVDLAEAPPITRMSLFAGIGVALLAVGYWLGDSPTGVETQTEEASEADETLEAVSKIDQLS